MLMPHAVIKRSKPSISRALHLFLLFSFLFSPRVMSALDPHTRISQYGHSSWKIQDGYFGGQPVSVTQTTDGYLWIGTSNGVFRFDGVEFVSWTTLSGEKLPSTDVHAVLGARDGSLWIATANGLTVEENDELFHTPVVDRVIELVLIGLSRIRAAAAN